MPSLVGSGMCMRDRLHGHHWLVRNHGSLWLDWRNGLHFEAVFFLKTKEEHIFDLLDTFDELHFWPVNVEDLEHVHELVLVDTWLLHLHVSKHLVFLEQPFDVLIDLKPLDSRFLEKSFGLESFEKLGE